MLKRLCAGLALLAIFTAHAVGLEYIVSQGKLSDDDFFRSVACGAAPGGNCISHISRWRATRLNVALIVTDPHPAPRIVSLFRKAVAQALSELNGAHAGVALSLVPGQRADIRIYLVATHLYGVIRGTGNRRLDGNIVGAAFTSIGAVTGAITDAQIAVSRDTPAGQVRSVMLEEITQALGLIHDIRNSYYNARSIFSEDSNAVTRLRGQDLMALRRLYAAK